MKPVTWVQPQDLVRHELWQSAQEGRPIADIRERWQRAGGPLDVPRGGVSTEIDDPVLRGLAVQLLVELDELPDPSAGTEPGAWSDIRALLAPPSGPPITKPAPAEPLSADRIHGAWLGRAVGCVLGKPVEKVPRAGIQEILVSTGRWPLRRYFTAAGLDPAVADHWPWNRASAGTSLEENIAGTPEDDDLNYTLMALRLLERHGAGFGAGDVATGWLLDLPAGRSFTAERIAYRNLLLGLQPPATATTQNPFREWIGAQIRTDLYGWVNPGDPLRAAEWAWRDASVSHTRNGLYGAMFVAAMASVAVLGAGIDTVLDVGAAVVPAGSRAAAAISLGRRLAADGREPVDAYATLEETYAGLHWVHALNNTALVAYALAAGRGDFDTSICTVVAGGWDTDSNGATVGAVVGAMAGAAAIDPYWTAPLRNRLSSSVPGCDGLTFDAVTARTLALAGRFGEPGERAVPS